MAVDAGADFFKMQHFDVAKLVNASDKEWYQRLSVKQVPNEFIRDAKALCDERGIPFLCTAHDEASLEYLLAESLIKSVKIGSGECGNRRLLEMAISSGYPILISLGMHTHIDVMRLISYLSDRKCENVVLLHCVTGYPVESSNVNLSYVSELRSFCPYLVGYSDHTEGITFPVAAVALGACLIEKHISVDFNVAGSQDWKVSLSGTELRAFMRAVGELHEGIRVQSDSALTSKGTSPQELKSKEWAMKSPYLKRSVKAGSKLELDDVVFMRPFTGLTESDVLLLLGREFMVDVSLGDPVFSNILHK